MYKTLVQYRGNEILLNKLGDNEKMKYNPMSKEFQEEAKSLGLTGNQLIYKYINEHKLPNPNDISRKYNDKWAMSKDYKSYRDYCKNLELINRDKYNERQREYNWRKGISSPIYESEAGVKFGIEIAEKYVSATFEDVVRMPYHNHGFDWI